VPIKAIVDKVTDKANRTQADKEIIVRMRKKRMGKWFNKQAIIIMNKFIVLNSFVIIKI
jgi:hypothetical protein